MRVRVLTTEIRPNDFLGTLWTLTGVRDLAVIVDGTAGCSFFHFVTSPPAVRAALRDRLFSTVLEEEDIALGGGEARLAAAIREVDRRHRPAAIAVVSNPVSALIGVDVDAVIRELAPETGARLLGFPGGGWRGTAEEGAARAMEALCREFCRPPAGPPQGVNLFAPPDPERPGEAAELRTLLERAGLEVRAVFPLDLATGDIAALPRARLNVVARPAGLLAARHLADAYGVPYVEGPPEGEDPSAWLDGLTAAAERRAGS